MLDIIRYYDHPIERAIAIAIEAHAHQVDKQNRPYILHVLRVMMKGATDEERIVGVLHDLFEDTNYTYEDLLHLGFASEIVDAITALTHAKWQSNNEYYTQVKENPLALQVKLYDMEDNMSRLDSIQDEATKKRLTEKYQRGWEVLTQDLEWEAL